MTFRAASVSLLVPGVVSGLILGGLALADPGVASATPTITAHLQPKGAVPYDKTTSVAGRVTSGGAGMAGQSVQLKADTFPYGSYRTQGTTTTDAKGRYSFTVKPPLNTRYRVTAVGTSATAPATAYVTFDPVSASSSAPRSVVYVHATIRYPRSVREAGRKVYFYLALNGRQRAPYKTTVRVGPEYKPGYSHITASLRTGVPRGTAYRYRWEYVLGDQPYQGLGLAACRSKLPGDTIPLGLSRCPVPKYLTFSPWS